MAKEMFKKNQEEACKKIKDAHEKKALIPFIGAGFSENISPKYSWNSILKKLNGYLANGVACARVPNIDIRKVDENAARRMEWLMWKVGRTKHGNQKEKFHSGRKWFVKRVENILDDLDAIKYRNNEKWELHKLLSQKFDRIYTTNWDRSIEIAHENNNVEYHKIYPVGNNGFTSMIDDDRGNIKKTSEIENGEIEGHHLIFKYHGDWDGESIGTSLATCETDYFGRITAIAQNKSEIDRTLLKDLTNHTFLFIGYSFSDSTVAYIFNQLQIILRQASNLESQTESYWILLNPPKVTTKYWINFYRDRGLIPVFFSDKARLKDFLVDLFQKL